MQKYLWITWARLRQLPVSYVIFGYESPLTPPSDFLVNTIPWLAYVPDWFPGAGWKKTAREWRDQKDHALNSSYYWTKQQAVSPISSRYTQAHVQTLSGCWP